MKTPAFAKPVAILLLLATSVGTSLAEGTNSNFVRAPSWELPDINGKIVKSSIFAGQVVILDFWATWCPPCRAEIPGFVELQKKYGDKGLVVIGVSLDKSGPEAVKPFVKQFEVNYPVMMGDAKIVKDFGGIEGIPTTFIIDRQGRIVNRHVGFVPQTAFEAEIKPLLSRDAEPTRPPRPQSTPDLPPSTERRDLNPRIPSHP